MRSFKKIYIDLSIILISGLIAALICQLFVREPTDKYIHIRNFRYGKDPSVIRCNRGDRLHLTFSSEDTGHSFFLEEFDIDAKVNPANDEVAVFKPGDPTEKPVFTKELTFVAKHPGILNYIVSKSAFRCHVWCGPMHAFEQGKLIILPNTLLAFSLGAVAGILLLWIISVFKTTFKVSGFQHERGIETLKPETLSPAISTSAHQPISTSSDLLEKSAILKKLLLSRWPQIILIIFSFVMIYIVIMTTIFGTKVSGRNLGVLLMWAVWLFILVAILTPLAGRAWCTICPLPFLGDWLQRRSFFTPEKGSTKGYRNKFYGLFLKWPKSLDNSWPRLIVFLVLTTFSITLVAVPKVSGMALLAMLLIPTVMAVIWELRAFCRYLCPITVFVSPFSENSFLAIRNKSQAVCDRCTRHFCQKGSSTGWACPYGINVGEMTVNRDCGLCLECLRSCSYKNVSLYSRPFGTVAVARNNSEAWLSIGIFTMAIIYSILYLGSWTAIRDFVNIIDKNNWGLFGIYTVTIWALALIIIPGLLYLLSYIGKATSKIKESVGDIFLIYSGSLLPLGLMLWVSFVIPMLFVNTTFIFQAASDPFGWGWDFFGTAGIPWKQFIPQYIPWIQSFFVLTGFYISLRNIKKVWIPKLLGPEILGSKQLLLISLPAVIFILGVTVSMLFFFTN